jgi:hypothetical protein
VGVGADLPDTEEDARGLAKVLKDEGRCAYPDGQVRLLTGEDAHRDNVLAGLDELAKVPEDASVIVFFSGHGYRVGADRGTSYYLMPHGYKVKELAQTAVSGTEFADRLAAIKSDRLLVLLDCCHAGGFDVSAGDAAEKSPEGLPMVKAPLPDEALSLFKQLSGRFIIASSRADELSYAGKPYSAFTAALISALCGKGAAQKDGYVRVMDIVTHTSAVVPRLTKDRQHPTADFQQGGNFRLAYYAGGEEKPKALPRGLSRPEIEPEPGAFRQVEFDLSGQTVESQTILKVENNPGIINPGWKVGTVIQNPQGGVTIDGTGKVKRRRG